MTSLPPEDRPPVGSHDSAHPRKIQRGQAVTIAIVVVVAIVVVLVLLL